MLALGLGQEIQWPCSLQQAAVNSSANENTQQKEAASQQVVYCRLPLR
jgi:hypothetical protein